MASLPLTKRAPGPIWCVKRKHDGLTSATSRPRRLESEKQATALRRERAELLARTEGGAKTEAALASLQASSAASLAQYKEDNAVLISEVRRLQAECDSARVRIGVLEDTGEATAGRPG